MSTFRFQAGPIRATVNAESLEGARAVLATLVRREGLEWMHLAGSDDVRLWLCLGMAEIEDDCNWSC